MWNLFKPPLDKHATLPTESETCAVNYASMFSTYDDGYKAGLKAGKTEAPSKYADLKTYREEVSRGVAHAPTYKKEMDALLQEFYSWAEGKFLPTNDPEVRRSNTNSFRPDYTGGDLLRRW